MSAPVIRIEQTATVLVSERQWPAVLKTLAETFEEPHRPGARRFVLYPAQLKPSTGREWKFATEGARRFIQQTFMGLRWPFDGTIKFQIKP